MNNSASYRTDETGIEALCLTNAAFEIERLQKYEALVHFIATECLDLSYDKSALQRDKWQRQCANLIRSDYEND
jgi:hypothetical protein